MDRNEAKPYQVVFTDSPMAMTWMYPKPRAITRISVFPIPIMAGDELFHEHGAVIQCTLEYWDKCLKAFQQYSTFTLSEEKINHLDLPLITDHKRLGVSDTWRVVMCPYVRTHHMFSRILNFLFMYFSFFFNYLFDKI